MKARFSVPFWMIYAQVILAAIMVAVFVHLYAADWQASMHTIRLTEREMFTAGMLRLSALSVRDRLVTETPQVVLQEHRLLELGMSTAVTALPACTFAAPCGLTFAQLQRLYFDNVGNASFASSAFVTAPSPAAARASHVDRLLHCPADVNETDAAAAPPGMFSMQLLLTRVPPANASAVLRLFPATGGGVPAPELVASRFVHRRCNSTSTANAAAAVAALLAFVQRREYPNTSTTGVLPSLQVAHALLAVRTATAAGRGRLLGSTGVDGLFMLAGLPIDVFFPAASSPSSCGRSPGSSTGVVTGAVSLVPNVTVGKTTAAGTVQLEVLLLTVHVYPTVLPLTTRALFPPSLPSSTNSSSSSNNSTNHTATHRVPVWLQDRQTAALGVLRYPRNISFFHQGGLPAPVPIDAAEHNRSANGSGMFRVHHATACNTVDYAAGTVQALTSHLQRIDAAADAVAGGGATGAPTDASGGFTTRTASNVEIMAYWTRLCLTPLAAEGTASASASGDDQPDVLYYVLALDPVLSVDNTSLLTLQIVTWSVLIGMSLISLVVIRTSLIQPLKHLAVRMHNTTRLKFGSSTSKRNGGGRDNKQPCFAFKELENLQATYQALESSTRMFSKYVPREVVKDLMLVASGGDGSRAHAGGGSSNGDKAGEGLTGGDASFTSFLRRQKQVEQRLITVLFADIANFTTLCEMLPTEDLVVLLDHYFSRVTTTLLQHGCTIDKFIGDAVMGFWGAPLDYTTQGFSCCCAALHLQKVVLLMVPVFQSVEFDLVVRVGCHRGFAIVGNVGCSQRMSYTALGDTVNSASRLEGSNKMFGTRVIVSAPVADDIYDAEKIFVLRELGVIKVKGKSEGIAVFHLVGIAPGAVAYVRSLSAGGGNPAASYLRLDHDNDGKFAPPPPEGVFGTARIGDLDDDHAAAGAAAAPTGLHANPSLALSATGGGASGGGMLSLAESANNMNTSSMLYIDPIEATAANANAPSGGGSGARLLAPTFVDTDVAAGGDYGRVSTSHSGNPGSGSGGKPPSLTLPRKQRASASAWSSSSDSDSDSVFSGTAGRTHIRVVEGPVGGDDRNNNRTLSPLVNGHGAYSTAGGGAPGVGGGVGKAQPSRFSYAAGGSGGAGGPNRRSVRLDAPADGGGHHPHHAKGGGGGGKTQRIFEKVARWSAEHELEQISSGFTITPAQQRFIHTLNRATQYYNRADVHMAVAVLKEALLPVNDVLLEDLEMPKEPLEEQLKRWSELAEMGVDPATFDPAIVLTSK